MYHTYKQTQVYYEIIGNGDIPIVFLHGWGGSTQSFSFICKRLTFNYKALFIDFPPFGKSEEPQCDFTIFDYSEMVSQIMEINGFNNPCIVGHSFGGRVAILLASKNVAKNVILISSAGMKVRHGIKYYLKIYKHKIFKKLHIKNNGGSSDYKALSSNMRKTFVNIVTTNLEKYAINIKVPTILFWGKKDKDTPFYMAKRLKKLIADCEIIAFNKSGHFCYIENCETFVNVINHFAVQDNKL